MELYNGMRGYMRVRERDKSKVGKMREPDIERPYYVVCACV